MCRESGGDSAPMAIGAMMTRAPSRWRLQGQVDCTAGATWVNGSQLRHVLITRCGNGMYKNLYRYKHRKVPLTAVSRKMT